MTAQFKPYPFQFIQRQSARRGGPALEHHPVAIIGGGIAGMTAALALAVQGVRSVVIEADDTVCFGSRAICISRRSLEIFDRLGALEPILAKGLAWDGGRSFYGNTEVLQFSMPHDANQKLPPMINIQQYYIEEFLAGAIEAHSAFTGIRWGSKVTSVQAAADDEAGVLIEVENPALGDRYHIRADYVIACDGGRSTVRELLGLQLKGTAYEGRYVVADIELESALPTERLAWFNPPSNPESTILMHKQPDNVWRIDYQLRDDEDPEEAVKPENVLPRVQAHLSMMGENGPWSPLWITIYKANALSLERYRHGRIFFAGDAAHLVPIFGVRGANSAIDDVDNLAWKLAQVIHGHAADALLDSYTNERLFAAHENLKSGMKSTEFMAPPTFAFRMMREAVLNLAVDTPAVRSLINPRQTSAIAYDSSGLVAPSSEDRAFAAGPAAGSVMLSAPVEIHAFGVPSGKAYLSAMVRAGHFLVLHFCTGNEISAAVRDAVSNMLAAGLPLKLLAVTRTGGDSVGNEFALDHAGTAFSLYGAERGATYVVRPDGHVLGRWPAPSAPTLERAVHWALGIVEKAAIR